MEVYNPQDGRNWHEIKYTLQHGKYKGGLLLRLVALVEELIFLTQIFLKC